MRKLLLATVMMLLGWTLSASAFAGGITSHYEKIPSFDGIQLAATVVEPKDQGVGPFPLVVMPAAWAMPNALYLARAKVLASRGYIVVAYTSRGFLDSQGQIDIAGEATVEDVSAVIDWALKNTRADARRIGASGISYGAGTSLMAAERDPRIKVVAALSGWSDLRESLYANDTLSLQSALFLTASGALTGRPGPELSEVTRLLFTGKTDAAVDKLLPLLPVRNPASGISALNANGTAVLLANPHWDSFFPPNQFIDFYNTLTGPKQLMLTPGDHATPEMLGAALGVPNDVYDAVTRWLDYHLKGIDNGVDREKPVRLKSQLGVWRSYANWEQVQASATTYSLAKPGGLLMPTGMLSTTPGGIWNHSILTGRYTVAESGLSLISGMLPPITSSVFISRADAGVWAGPISWGKTHVTGISQLHVTVTPGQPNTSLFAYLYDVDLIGISQLISHRPYTLRNATPNQPKTLDIDLQSVSWDIQSGHRLMLVIDTVDARYAGASVKGGQVTFSSPDKNPSTLTVPFH